MNLKSLLGADIQSIKIIEEDYRWALSLGYSFIFADIYTGANRTYTDKLSDSRFDKESATRFLNIKDGSIVNGVVGKVSSWIDLDNEDEQFRVTSEKALIEELEWAVFQGFPAVFIRLTKANNVNLARVLSTFLSSDYVPFRVWIGAPMVNEDEFIIPNGDTEHKDDPLSWWRLFSILVGDFISNFSLVLAVPLVAIESNVIDRWFSEPVAALETKTDIFLANKKGYPVLSHHCQMLIKKFFKLKVQLVVSGDVINQHGYISYQQYLSWLWTNKPPMTIYENHSKDMEDHLQDPLQPLSDHLPSSTYTIFEMDPYKYAAYEKAVNLAITDLFESRKITAEITPDETTEITPDETTEITPNETTIIDQKSYASILGGAATTTTSTTEEGKRDKIIIMVLGAGRGPLVDASFRAADAVNCDVKIYVVEKNPNAVVFLRNRLVNDWMNRDVELCPGDMRDVVLPELADIFVSELLGSFGDNELSPECLDGAQHFLKPDGISIPTSYTSYIAPLQSTKLYSEMKSQKPPRCSKKTKNASLETPYVVRLLNCALLAPVEPVFTFVHPKKDITASNDRYKEIKFTIQNEGTVHGFAGYFHSVLYKDVTMSIHPDWHSPDMFSWFPLAFPLVKPIQVDADSQLSLHMWRVKNNKAVWYEWACTSPEVTTIHNTGGRSYSMSLLSK